MDIFNLQKVFQNLHEIELIEYNNGEIDKLHLIKKAANRIRMYK